MCNACSGFYYVIGQHSRRRHCSFYMSKRMGVFLQDIIHVTVNERWDFYNAYRSKREYLSVRHTANRLFCILDTYIYDVNISYHAKQLVWVEGFLLPILEKELGLTCYIHDRDHIPGVPSVRNIASKTPRYEFLTKCVAKNFVNFQQGRTC